MTSQVQKRRGTTAEHSTFTGAEGEITVDTSKDTAVVHDGVSAGGKPLAREDLNNVAGATIASKLSGVAQSNVDINSGAIDGTTVGLTTPATGAFTSLSASGNISVTGTVDGRDVAADGAKLDGIEAGADVTDTANVTAAGALMDSELADIAAVKALNQGVGTSNTPTFSGVIINNGIADGAEVEWQSAGFNSWFADNNAGNWRLINNAAERVTVDTSYNLNVLSGNITVAGTVDGRDLATDGAKLDAINQTLSTTSSPTFANITASSNITVGGTVDGRDVAADGAKLDGIEAGADVTDTANVTAAGALMDSELTNITAVKAINQGLASTDSPTFHNLTIDNGIADGGSVILASSGYNAWETDNAFGSMRWINNAGTRMTLDGSYNLTLDSGSMLANSHYFKDDTDSGLKHNADGDYSLMLNGQEQVEISTEGVIVRNGKRLAAYNSLQGNWGTRTLLLWDESASPAQPAIGFHAAANTTAGIFKFYGPTSEFEIRNAEDTGFIAIRASAFTVSSDYRLKENIVPLEGAIDRLKQLPVHRFNFIDKPEVIVDGYLAHELAEVIPEAVTGDKDATHTYTKEIEPAVLDDDGNEITPAVTEEVTEPLYQGVDQSKVTPLLVAALQEAIAKIEALEARVAILEAK